MAIPRRAALVAFIPFLSGCAQYDAYQEYEREKYEDAKELAGDAYEGAKQTTSETYEETKQTTGEILSQDGSLSDAIANNTTITGVTMNRVNGVPHVAISVTQYPKVRDRHCGYDAATGTTQCNTRENPVTVSDVIIYEEDNLSNAFSTDSTGNRWLAPLTAPPDTYNLVASVRFEEVNAIAELGFQVTITEETAELEDNYGWSSNA